MQWMRTDVVFPDRRAILVITRNDVMMHEDIIGSLRSDPWKDESAIMRVHDDLAKAIAKARPDLYGVCIHFISYEFRSDTWEIGITHGNAEFVRIGEEAKRISLNPKVNFTYPPVDVPEPTVVT